MSKLVISVSHLNVEVEEDVWKEGIVGHPTCRQFDKIGEEFSSLADAKAAMAKAWGLEMDRNAWVFYAEEHAPGEFRMTFDQLEDADANRVEKDDPKWKSWKRGKTKLYAVRYEFRCRAQWVEPATVSDEEVERAEMTKG